MKIKLLFIFTICIFNSSLAQWSTSPYADSGLYVCPGFDPGLVTFDDGSSIVLGILSSYIYAQKLDPAGYKVWPQPVLIFHNDSSDMNIGDISNSTWFCSDGDGGVILFWQDYRGAYYAQDGPKNSTTYLQRVDKNGAIKWGTGGIKVNNLFDGDKTARITSDGSGGCALMWTEYGFDYPASPNKNYLKLARYDLNGNRLWLQTLDSTFSGAIPISPMSIIRSGRNYFMKYYSSGNIQKSINDNGDLSSLRNMQAGGIYPSTNGTLYFYTESNSFSTLTKIGPSADTLWNKTIIIDSSFVSINCPLVTDGIGGIFITFLKGDTIIYVDSVGNVQYRKLNGVGSFNYCFTDGKDGILTVNATTVKRYNGFGKMVWKDSVIYLYDPSNAYSKYFCADNNGGFIVTYWSTLGGIYAQHSGRNGKLGIITGITNHINNIPVSVELYQNYPNPFNPSTTISFSVGTYSYMSLRVYDLLGREVATLVDEKKPAGKYSLQWNAAGYSSGIYFYRLIVNNNIYKTHKMVITK